MKYAMLICIVLSSSPFAFCQSDYGPPEGIAKTLKSPDREAQQDVAKWLGLKDPQRDFRGCDDIRVDTAKLDEQGKTSVLQVKCGYDLNIVVLRSHDPLSERLDSRYIYAAYDRSTATFASLIHPGVQEIIIHNAATVSGNLYEAYFLVLRLVGGKLQVVFSGLETGTEPHFGGVPRNQKSTFTITPASRKDSGEITQEATITVGKRSHIIRRSFGWSEDWQMFCENGIQSVVMH